MSFIKDVFFGGAEKEASQEQINALNRAQDIIVEGTAKARGDAIPLFQAAQENIGQGFQGALDVFGQTVPQQLQSFQGGNVAAQQALLAGLPQQQAAILGGQLDPNALQAQSLALPDPSTFQRQLPNFANISDIVSQGPPVGFGGPQPGVTGTIPPSAASDVNPFQFMGDVAPGRGAAGSLSELPPLAPTGFAGPTPLAGLGGGGGFGGGFSGTPGSFSSGNLLSGFLSPNFGFRGLQIDNRRLT